MPAGRLPNVLCILALDPTLKFGSLEEETLTLARAFRDGGGAFIPVFMVPLRPDDAACYREEGLAHAALDLTVFTLHRLRRLFRLVATHHIEVANWNFTSPLSPYMLALAARYPRLCQVYTNHDSRPAPVVRRAAAQRRFKRALLARYDAVLAVSDCVAQWLHEADEWPPIHRFRHFVNTERFRPDPAARDRVRRELGVDDRFIGIVIGQLIPEKGIHVLLEAWTALPPPAELWVVGLGPQREALGAMAARLALESRVRFFDGQRRVEPLLQAADVAFCPSLWAEAVGLVILEAAACGLPVIASRIGGIPEFVRDGVTGVLVPPGDVYGMQQALRCLHDDPAVRRAMGRAARDRAEAEFSTAAALDHNVAFYRTQIVRA